MRLCSWLTNLNFLQSLLLTKWTCQSDNFPGWTIAQFYWCIKPSELMCMNQGPSPCYIRFNASEQSLLSGPHLYAHNQYTQNPRGNSSVPWIYWSYLFALFPILHASFQPQSSPQETHHGFVQGGIGMPHNNINIPNAAAEAFIMTPAAPAQSCLDTNFKNTEVIPVRLFLLKSLKFMNHKS